MMPKQRVALFIDAENISPNHLPDFLEHGRSLGKITIARCYGDAAALERWDAAIARSHLIPVQTPPCGAKANASDFALVIDAVSLLHRNLFDHAVIASSDADFTLLAIHIREQGKGIDGIGEGKANSSLKTAFDQFIILKKTPAAKSAPSNRPKVTPVLTVPTQITDISTRLVEAAKELLPPGSKTTLGNMGKQLKAKMGANYPSGKLSKHMGKHSTFKIEGSTIERLK